MLRLRASVERVFLNFFFVSGLSIAFAFGQVKSARDVNESFAEAPDALPVFFGAELYRVITGERSLQLSMSFGARLVSSSTILK